MTTARRLTEETLSAHYLLLLCQHLHTRGISSEQVLAGTELGLAELEHPNRQVPLALCLKVFANTQRLLPDPGLGLHLGQLLNIRSHGFLGYAVLSSRTIGEATDLAVRYFRTRTSLLEIRLFREGEMAVIQLDERVPLGSIKVMVLDALISLFMVCGQQVTGRKFNAEIRLSYPEQAHHAALRAQLGDRLSFDCAFTQVRFPRVGLQIPLGLPDPQLLAMAKVQCEAELQRLHDEGGLLPDVRRITKLRLAETATLESVANDLHLSPRTLRRRLAELGTSFQMILEQLRRGRAVELLLHSGLSVDQIATELGYLDPSNFGRAFRRWTGQSPRAYRTARLLSPSNPKAPASAM